MMNKYLYNATPRLVRRSHYDSPLPDFLDISMDNSGQEQTLEYALQDILDINEKAEAHRLQETYSLDLKNESRSFFQLKDYKNNIRVAS